MNDLDPGGFVDDALRELFSQGSLIITQDEIDECGLAYIKDVDQAGVYATELAADYAFNYNYKEDEDGNYILSI